MWPFSCVNNWLITTTGTNFATILAAVAVILCATYSVVFLFRIFRNVIQLSIRQSNILCLLYFSFSYIMLASMVPDHFVMSQFCLLLTLWISGEKLKKRSALNMWQTIVIFLFTAGVSLNNGLKVFLAALVTRRRRFFKPLYILFAVIIPACIIWSFARWEYSTWEAPKYRARQEQKARVQQQRTENIRRHVIDYLLGDVLRNRPMIVRYVNWFNYVVEGLLILCFLLGLWVGRHHLFMWTAMSIFLMDMTLHMGLGFGINEIYIMSPHYMFALPVVFAYLLKNIAPRWHRPATILIALMACYIFIWNVIMLTEYFS